MTAVEERPVGDTELPDEEEANESGESGGNGEGDGEGILVEVDDDEPESPEEVAAARIAELEGQVKENYERLVRTTADFDNFRKRSRREVADARVSEQSRVLREMLPVLDNLERAIAAAIGESAEFVSLREGIELVHRQFLGGLERFSVARVVAKGQAFDPNVHEAVSQMETDEYPPGTVVEVLQPGYTIGDRLLRAALAVVAMAPSVATVEDADSGDNDAADDDAADDDAADDESGEADDDSDGADGDDETESGE